MLLWQINVYPGRYIPFLFGFELFHMTSFPHGVPPLWFDWLDNEKALNSSWLKLPLKAWVLTTYCSCWLCAYSSCFCDFKQIRQVLEFLCGNETLPTLRHAGDFLPENKGKKPDFPALRGKIKQERVRGELSTLKRFQPKVEWGGGAGCVH